MEFGLRTSLQSEVELPSVRDDLFDHGLHLVHLDGIDHIVLTFIIIFLGGFLETAPRLLDPVVKNIGETEQHGRRDITQRQLVHHLTQVDLRIVLAWGDIDITLLVDAEIRGAPTVDVVELLRVIDGPFLHKSNSSFIFATLVFIFS